MGHGKPDIPEFRDVRQDDDGTWRAVHVDSGREAVADTRADLELRALVIRVTEGFKRAWP
ncbi:hypothetical protein [Sphaerisporangium dianthi]|uniref:Uncharacterized protein n=1 Tax=Sphaerisporangium dianthi TaxID=1436120 RepID=A0ABV9CRQ0_9ACTN